MKFLASVVTAVAVGLAAPAAAQDRYLFGATENESAPRATLTFDGITPFVALDTGWLRSTGTHMTANANYLTGVDNGLGYRSFFSFAIGALAVGSPYTSATLTLKTGNSAGAGPFNLVLYDVDANLVQLDQERMSGDAGGQAIYADLGSGASYGALAVAGPTSLGQTITINLNQTFLDRVNAGLLQNFSIGGALEANAAAAVPEPATWAMLVGGFGAVGAAMRQRRRRARRAAVA